MDIRTQAELDLIAGIYDAVIEPARWNDAIDGIRRHLGFQLCTLTVVSIPSGRVLVGAQSNVPHPFSETAHLYGNDALEQWGGLKRIETLVQEEPMLFSHYNRLADLVGRPFYENWSRPQGLVDQLALVLEFNPRCWPTSPSRCMTRRRPSAMPRSKACACWRRICAAPPSSAACSTAASRRRHRSRPPSPRSARASSSSTNNCVSSTPTSGPRRCSPPAIPWCAPPAAWTCRGSWCAASSPPP